MAKKTESSKNVLERVYIVPLRKEYMKAPNWKRTPRALKALREFISKHMKSDEVIIGKYANQLIWKDGIKHPPHHIKVNAVKDEKGKVTVELAELPPSAKREDAKFQAREKKAEDSKKETPKEEQKKSDVKDIEAKVSGPSDESKAIEKEEIKEMKDESKRHYHHPGQKQPKEQHIHPQQPTAPKSQ